MTFFTEFKSLIECHISSNIDLFFLGDLNEKIDKINDYNTQHFNKLLHNFNLSQNVSLPTHDSDHIFDLNITNNSSKLNIHPFYLDTCISDYKKICVDLNLPKPHIKKITFSDRRINNINFTQFNRNISVAFSNFEHFDLDSLVNYYNSTLSFVLDKYAPLKTITVTLRTSNPWSTTNLLNKRCTRRQLERNWRKTKKESDKPLFKKLKRNQINCYIKN